MVRQSGENEPGWFSVRCLFQHEPDPAGVVPGNPENWYEERMTLWLAESSESAIALAEREALEYAEFIGCEYLELAQSYRMPGQPAQGEEAFSLIRSSELEPEEYLTRFFDTGTESQRIVDEEDSE